jgi:EmrB/QacA subfamily drug resistance transporter
MSNRYAVLCAVCCGTFLSAYLSSCINIALPNIMAALNFNMDSIVWVTLGYMLPYGSIMPLTGKLGDQFGTRKIYIIGLTLFSTASMLCGLATSSTMMVIFRVIQGVGAGILLPNALTIVAETFEPHERGQAVGIWGAIVATGSAIGPTAGGYILEKFDWHMVFFSIGPFCLISILFAIVVIPVTRRSSPSAIDFPGAALLIVSISTLLVALNRGQTEGWQSLYISSLFYTSVAALILFLAVELTVKQPIVDIRLFHSRNFSMAVVVAFLAFFGFLSTNFLMPFFLKSLLNYSSISAGLMMLPMTGAIIFLSPAGGRLADRFGARLPTFCGVTIMAGGLFWLSSISADYSKHDFFIRLMLFGVGLGLANSPLTNCAMSSVPQDKIGVGSGIFNLSQVIGGSVGVVLAETLLTRREIYHAAVMKEYLNPATHASQQLFSLIRGLWGKAGMDSSMIATATHGWATGQELLPQQFEALKTILNGLVSRQAAIFSFQDVFYALALAVLAGGVLALFIRKPAQQNRDMAQ